MYQPAPASDPGGGFRKREEHTDMSNGSIKMVAVKPVRYAGVAYARGQEFHVKQAMHARLLVAAKRARYAIASIAHAPAPVVVTPPLTPTPQPEPVQIVGERAAVVLDEYFAALKLDLEVQPQSAAEPAQEPASEPAPDTRPEPPAPAAPAEAEQTTSKRRYRRRDMTAQDSEG